MGLTRSQAFEVKSALQFHLVKEISHAYVLVHILNHHVLTWKILQSLYQYMCLLIFNAPQSIQHHFLINLWLFL